MASKTYKVPDIRKVRKMKLKEALVHVKQAVDILKGVEDFSTEEIEAILIFLNKARWVDDLGSVAKAATKYGLGELFVKKSKSLEDYFMSPEGCQGMKNLEMWERMFMNYSDHSSELACDLGKLGAIDHIVATLKKLEKQPDSKSKGNRVNFLLGILHNSIYQEQCRSNRSIYRKAGVVSIVKKYLDSGDMAVKIDCLLTLAYVVDEKESEMLGKAEAIVYLVDTLKKAVEASNHKGSVESKNVPTYYTAAEILDGLNHLTINDANKKTVLQNGGVPAISRMLTPGFSAKEQCLAVKALWNLAFDETIRESKEMKESIKAIRRLTNSGDKSLSAISKNALWEISDKHSQEKGRKQPGKDSGGHIMISYNWTHQERALNIRDALEKAGYKVWIDVDKMEDDILDSMAEAVVKSEVILLCISQPYHASQSCRSEATYAYKKKKPVIPLMVEADYEPEGWLDILIGTKLYYKFCSDTEMRNNLSELKKAIGARCRESKSGDNVDGPVKAHDVEKISAAAAAPSSRSNASSWSTERVQKWFEETKLPQLKSSLDFCDGSDLLDMYERYSRDSSAFQKDCKSDFGLQYQDTLRLTSALKKLFK